MDLFEELSTLVRELEHSQVPYALCGGLAMAVHAVPRATMDIDLLVPPDGLDRARSVAQALGFTLPSRPMEFQQGTIKIERWTKPDSAADDLLPLDLLVVTPALEEVWNGRERAETEVGTISVVSRQGLIRLKQLRLSGQDRDDIARLEETGDET